MWMETNGSFDNNMREHRNIIVQTINTNVKYI